MRTLNLLPTRAIILIVSAVIAWLSNVYASEFPLWLCALKHGSFLLFLHVATDTLLTLCHVPRIQADALAKLSRRISIVLTTFLVVLIIDTFVTYACPWFSGMIRYFIIDLYPYYFIICPILSTLNYLGKKK